MAAKAALAFLVALLWPTAAGADYRVRNHPYYIADTVICTSADGRAWRCNEAPEREYRSYGQCMQTEWTAILLFANDARNNGRRLAARVRCVRTYDA